jgi:hypothetical protein
MRRRLHSEIAEKNGDHREEGEKKKCGGALRLSA